MKIKMRTRFLNNRLTPIIIVFGLVMIGFGLLLYIRLDEMMIAFESKTVEKNAERAAETYSFKLNSELEKLAQVAKIMENSDDDDDQKSMDLAIRFMDDNYSQETNIFIGLIAADCTPVYGESLSPSKFKGIKESLRGKGGVSYTTGGGVLFSYPIMHDENVRYVLYELCTSSNFADRFDISIYNGKANVCVMTRSEEMIVDFNDVSLEDESFYTSASVKKEFRRLISRMDLETCACEYQSTTRGDMYFFTSDVKGTDFILTGMVERDAVSNGLNNVPKLILMVFFLLFLMVMALSIFLLVTSQRIRESEALQRAKDAAEDANRAKSDFLANMSHEIRTPINAVLGMDEMILREFEDPTLRKYALNIKSSGKALLSLVNDILDFSKIEAGKMELVPDEYDLTIMAIDMINSMNSRATKKGLTLRADIDESMPHILYGDNIRLRQIILNLLSNAIKYTDVGGVTLSMSYEKLDGETICMHVSVRDTGIGIRKEDQARLFSAFERLDLERNRTIEGTGLGMRIVKQLLELMDSEIRLESVYGEGSNFYFSVNQRVLDWAPIGNLQNALDKVVETEETYQTSFAAPDAKILLVDDIDMNIIVVKGLLKNTFLQIDTASDGKEALAMTEKKEYDLLLIDHRMPVMDGVEMIKTLRRASDNPNQNKPCIALTANALAGAREEYLAAGFNDYLIKPVEGKRMEQTLIDFLPDDMVKTPEEAEKVSRIPQEADFMEDIPVEEDEEETMEERMKALDAQGLIDMSDGISYAGSLDMFEFALQFFCDGVEDKAQEIEGYYDSEDWENYTTKVHGLKSSAKVVGARDLSEQARLLEMAGRDSDLDYIRENTAKVMEFYRSYKGLMNE